MMLALAILLALAAACDIRAHRVPNWLSLAGLVLGLVWHMFWGGWPGLLQSLGGIGIAALALLPYAVRALGAGDVKLLGAVGALMGPQFLLWTLLGTLLAGGLLALGWAIARGALRETVTNALFGLHLLGAGAGVSSLRAASKAGKMPLAPAIALGAAFACLHLRLLG